MSQIWFTSDTHYNHKNIVRGTTEWKEFEPGASHQSVRDFDTLEEHNNKLVENINSLVKEDDTLYHLGDWSFGGYRNIWEFRKRLKCKNIHLVYGNHDEHIEKNKELEIDQAKEYLSSVFLKREAFESSHGINMQDLFSSVNYYKEIFVRNGEKGKTRIVMSHYAMRVWNKSHHGSIMLFGHSHGTLGPMTPQFANPTWIGDQYYIKNYRTMDVGVDTNNLKPYSLTQILEIMNKKDVLLEVDHHSKNTN